MTEPVPPVDHPAKGLRQAVGWSFALTGGREAVTFVVTMVLAGLLGPETYGVVALASVFILFLQMLLQSMIAAVVQRSELADADIDTAFWMTLGASLVLAMGSIAASGWWAAAFGIPELQAVVTALSALVVIKGLVVVQEALLRRDLNFRPLAIRTNVSVVAGGAAGIGLALAGAGVWALVGQQLVTGFVELVVLWGITTWRPRFRFRRVAANELSRFTLASSVGSVGVFVTNRSDALLLGLFFGPVAIGLYRLASRIMESISNFLMVSLQSVALPELARHQDDPLRFAERLGLIIQTSAIVGLPTLGIVAGNSDWIMAVLGPEWAPAGPALQVLCVVGAVKMTTATVGPMLQAIGRPQYQAALAWFTGILSTITFLVSGVLLENAGVADQILGISITRAALSAVMFTSISVWLFSRFGGLPARRMVAITFPSFMVGLVAAAVGGALQISGWLSGLPPLAALVIAGLATTTVAFVLLLAIEPQSRALVIDVWATVNRRVRSTDSSFDEDAVAMAAAQAEHRVPT